MNYVNEFGRVNENDLRSSVTMKRRPKSSVNNQSSKKSKSRRDDLFSSFHYKKGKDPIIK